MYEQPPLWPDGWEAEADAKAGRQKRYRWPKRITSDYGRPCTCYEPPKKPIRSVLWSI
ncbi:hypothetical protein ACWDXD_19925 [Streptomyces sp. NPDC003314]